MSTLGTNIGLKALLASQAHLETIGHNLSNASTPGYSRQTLHVSTSQPLMLRGLIQGSGIQTDVISRTVDGLLHGRITAQVAALGRIDARLDTLSNVESYLAGAGTTGASALLKEMFQSFASLSTAPEDAILRTGAVQSSASLASSLNQLAANGTTLSRDVFLRLKTNATQVNQIVERIGDLNRQIMASELGNSTANDLLDEREQKIKELAQYVDVRAVEDGRGAVRVLVGGRILVSPTTTAQMSVVGHPQSGNVGMQIDGEDVDVTGGAIGGLLAITHDFLPKLADDLDTFTRGLILETNRVHSTGVPKNGPFHSLVATSRLIDQDLDGSAVDELLSDAGLPFDVVDGVLYVNVIDDATGALTKHTVSIDADRTTAAQFLSSINSIAHLSAGVDSQGRIQIVSDAGFGFDFSARLDSDPDRQGTFGSGKASLATVGGEPFALGAGDTLDITGPLGTFSVAFPAGNFVQIGAATADEVAAVLNADSSFQASGLVASTVGSELVIQTSGSGAGETFQISGGTGLAAFGWSAGQTVVGSDASVTPILSGSYSGTINDTWTFRPNMDGTIGTTNGLLIQVYDQQGTLVTAIDVGPSYSPGDEVDVLHGVKVAFGFGDVSASDGDLFQVDVVGDSDTSDALVALGLNSLFIGGSASSIAVRDEILEDPGLLATSLSGASGDGSNVLRILSIETRGLSELAGSSLDEHLSDIVSGVGLEIDSAKGSREAEEFLLEGLEARRDQVSGVNTDEELVHMVEQEQAYTAAAQYLRVINDVTAELMNIL